MYRIEDITNKIICGDCLEVMKEIPDECVDLIPTDPPYGMKFMGKSWDKAVPSIKVWEECLRVLKPGAFAFVMCIPRQDCLSRMIVNLQDAGFETGFTSIYWTYATGFPKAQNISKAIDKKECKKQLIKKLGRKPNKKEFDEMWKEFREIIGKKQYASHAGNDDYAQPMSWGDKAINKRDLTISATPQAKALDGSYAGFQPKPAVEVILVAMKSLSEKTYVEQALRNRKGVTWLDDGRIPISADDRHEYGIDGDEGHPTVNCYGEYQRAPYEQNPQGRFPANLLVSEDILNDGIERKSGGNKGNEKRRVTSNENNLMAKIDQTKKYCVLPKSEGSFSRYFDLDKWWESQIKKLPESVQKTFPFLIVPKASKSEKNRGIGKVIARTKHGSRPCDWDTKNISPNFHPTVKPIRLISYLIALGSREGDIILDPYVGSGTSCISAKILSRNYIGIEISPNYCKIAEKRLAEVDRQPKLDFKQDKLC